MTPYGPSPPLVERFHIQEQRSSPLPERYRTAPRTTVPMVSVWLAHSESKSMLLDQSVVGTRCLGHQWATRWPIFIGLSQPPLRQLLGANSGPAMLTWSVRAKN